MLHVIVTIWLTVWEGFCYEDLFFGSKYGLPLL